MVSACWWTSSGPAPSRAGCRAGWAEVSAERAAVAPRSTSSTRVVRTTSASGSGTGWSESARIGGSGSRRQDSSAADPGHPAIVAAAAGPKTAAASETAASATWTNRPARSVRIAGRATIAGSAAGRRTDAASGTAANASWTTVARSDDAAAAGRESGTAIAARRSATNVTRTGSGRNASLSSATWRSRSRRNRRMNTPTTACSTRSIRSRTRTAKRKSTDRMSTTAKMGHGARTVVAVVVVIVTGQLTTKPAVSTTAGTAGGIEHHVRFEIGQFFRYQFFTAEFCFRFERFKKYLDLNYNHENKSNTQRVKDKYFASKFFETSSIFAGNVFLTVHT
uniref:(northern house mosquito) hypothetical protein n=1 Tax=Culex pipiens TaxID=7175 RepID=A0A8D8A802_CULPI